jgi:hypothetical protein
MVDFSNATFIVHCSPFGGASVSLPNRSRSPRYRARFNLQIMIPSQQSWHSKEPPINSPKGGFTRSEKIEHEDDYDLEIIVAELRPPNAER